MKKLWTLNYILSLKTFVVAALVFIFSSCNPTDEILEPTQTLPDLADALKAFDEEVQYVEYSANAESNARWASKKWKRKPTFFTLVSALNYTGLLKQL